MFFTTSWVKEGEQDSSWQRKRRESSFQNIPNEEKSNKLGRLFPADSTISLISMLVLIALMVDRSTFKFLKINLTDVPTPIFEK
jgi:hypothetical protein